jgi:small conductance mechanosensitive channel
MFSRRCLAAAAACRQLPVLVALFALLSALAPWPVHAADGAAPGGAPKVDSTIAVQSDAGTDAKIRTRAQQLFATVDGLGDVIVVVSGGVVELTGVAASKAAHEQALQLVRRIENVVDVRDDIVESRDLGERMSRMLDRLGAQVWSFIQYLPLLLVAAAVFAAFWWLAYRIAASARLGRRFAANPFLRDLARQLVRIAIVGVGVLLALEILDASTLASSVLGAAGVVGLAIGFALRDTVENYIASLLLSLRQPFDRDDLVTIDGMEGRVVRLTSRATVLMTPDGNHLRIPNAKVYKAVIVNYTRNPKRRFQFDVGVDTEQNLASAQELAAKTVAQMNGVLPDPPASCTVQQLGDSNVVLRVFGWVDQRQAEFLKVRSEAIRLVKGAFDRAGIVMPEPIYNVRVGQAASPGGTGDSIGMPSPDRAHPSTARVGPSPAEEPPEAIDIAPRDDLDQQIAADRRDDEDDLLHHRAPKE